MKRLLKRAMAGVAVMTAATGFAALAPGGVAFAAGVAQSPGAGLSPQTGGGGTAFTLTLPSGAACAGDSPTDGWRWQTYMVARSIDPSTLQFGSTGPVGATTGTGFKEPLFTPQGSPIVNQQTAAASPSPGPGPIINIPPADLQLFTPGQVPAGEYNIGIACTLGAASPTQMDRFWNVLATVTTDTSAAGGNAQVHWAKGVVDAAPVITGVTTSSTTGNTAATFTHTASDPANTTYAASATPAAGGAAIPASSVTAPNGSTPGSAVWNHGVLASGTSYTFSVSASNLAGTTPPAATPTTQTVSVVWPAVASLTATPGNPGSGQVLVSWTAPASGETPSGYDLVVRDPSNVQVGSTVHTVTPPSSPITVNNLTPGTAYTFTVTPTHPTAGETATPTTVSATPLSGQAVVQQITVNRPAGALVISQVCGSHGAIAADTTARTGFPDGFPAVTPANSSTVQTPTLGGTSPGLSPGTYAGTRANNTRTYTAGTPADPNHTASTSTNKYPYPTDANGIPNPNYPTYCGIDLDVAKFVTRGPGAGQFFATTGVINQLTVVDTRDADPGWTVNGAVSDFSANSGTDKFSGNQLGWVPVRSDFTPAYADSVGNTYTQQVNAGGDPNAAVGSYVSANTLTNATGLKQGKILASTPTTGSGCGPAQPGSTPTSCTGGLGTAVLDARLALLIPVTANAGDYTATLSFTTI